MLTVNGGVTLDSTTNVTLFIDQAGTTAGTNYSQLSASSNVNLAGAVLTLSGGSVQFGSSGVTCPTLHVGDVDTLVTAGAGTLSGTFASTPDGTTRSVGCSNGTQPTVRINYTSNSVTATVLL